jgi:hypothetical protein
LRAERLVSCVRPAFEKPAIATPDISSNAQ